MNRCTHKDIVSQIQYWTEINESFLESPGNNRPLNLPLLEVPESFTQAKLCQDLTILLGGGVILFAQS